jgi:hypothetical protein
MLQMFAFDKIGVLLSDLYFIDPEPDKGQEGPERGVRLEVRLLQEGEVDGSIYAARPIEIELPVWRADLLEAADGPPGSLDRAHHHPGVRGWEPGKRVFDRGLSSDPVRWVGEQLADLEGLLERAGIEPGEGLAADAGQLRAWVPEIERALSGLLSRVRAGELATAPDDAELTSARIGWL